MDYVTMTVITSDMITCSHGRFVTIDELNEEERFGML